VVALRKWYRDFLEDLRTLLHAGAPVRDALESLGRPEAGAAAAFSRELCERVKSGATLAEALRLSPRRVPPDHAALIEAGERGGILEDVLQGLVERLDLERKAAREFLAETAWPCFLLLAAVVLLPLYLVFTGESGSYWTVQIVFFSSLGALAFLATKAPALLRGNSRSAALVGGALLGVPGLGGLLLRLSLGRFFATLGRLLGALGSMEESLDLAAGVVTWRALRLQLLSLGQRLRERKTLSDAFRSSGVLRDHPAWIDRISVGEKAGTVDRTCLDLGQELQASVRASLRRWLRVLPVLITLLVGAIVLSRGLAVISRTWGSF
jgi:type II secretory pathway component PulF